MGGVYVCLYRVCSVLFLLKKVFFLFTPWRYCRPVSLELHTGTPLAITDILGAAGGYQLGPAKPLLYIYFEIYIYIYIPARSGEAPLVYIL